MHVLRVPPLRDRLSDLPELAAALVRARSAERFGMRPQRIAAGALERLAAYDWRRNNVRELRNVIERMVLAADGDVIDEACVPDEMGGRRQPAPGPGLARTFLELKAESERGIIVAALERNEWHVSRTARELGLADHASLLKIMRRHGVRRD